jgi:KDO2-lipid IV(A) lauroyltransferase
MARKRRRSNLGQFFYGLRYRVGELSLRAMVAALPYIPYQLVILFTSVMARMTYILLWRYRARMHENINQALSADIPDAAARQALVWRAWRNFARSILDTIAVMRFSRQQIIAAVDLEGEEHLKKALESGRGVLALSAHLGGFTMIGARLGAAGYPFSAVVKQPADQRFASLIDDYRAQLGIHTISAKPRREAVRGILKALRQNRIVLVIADEFKSGDVMVDFFGTQAPAPRGPASLALRTGAVTLPMFAIRNERGSLTLSVGAPIASVECNDLEQSVVATTALYTRYLEAAIRKYPDQWNWLGLPRRDSKLSRAQMAQIWREKKLARMLETAPEEKRRSAL